jgi:hypothetical protein
VSMLLDLAYLLVGTLVLAGFWLFARLCERL